MVRRSQQCTKLQQPSLDAAQRAVPVTGQAVLSVTMEMGTRAVPAPGREALPGVHHRSILRSFAWLWCFYCLFCASLVQL